MLRPKNFKGLRKRSLKSYQSDVYINKSQIKDYNFIQQYKDYFAISRAQSHNQIFFTIIYLKDQGINRW